MSFTISFYYPPVPFVNIRFEPNREQCVFSTSRTVSA